MSEQLSGSIFLIEIDKIKPNPFQPRREFDEAKLNELAESIRQYGVLQPLVVVRKEHDHETGFSVEYELIAGERRLRASKIADLKQVPVIIREEPADKVKLEIALIENLQREDLNAIDRARAFKQLIEEFNIRHKEVGAKIGKSREFVSNTLRLLSLPQEMQLALCDGRINEGHTRPLLMLQERPDEQTALFHEILARSVSVREAERISRRIAFERARKKDPSHDAKARLLERKLTDVLGTRVVLERKGPGGRISIEFFSEEELGGLMERIGLVHFRDGDFRAVPLPSDKQSDSQESLGGEAAVKSAKTEVRAAMAEEARLEENFEEKQKEPQESPDEEKPEAPQEEKIEMPMEEKPEVKSKEEEKSDDAISSIIEQVAKEEFANNADGNSLTPPSPQEELEDEALKSFTI